MIRMLLMLGTVALAAGAVLAAIPPLSKERLEADSTLIVTGRIVKVTTTTRELGRGDEDTIYHVEIDVAKVEKGNVASGKPLVAQTWEPKKRERGWAGPQGQNVTPEVGQNVRCHLRGSESEGYSFLEPNGLELLKPPASTTRRD
jgi:hypothetical protein